MVYMTFYLEKGGHKYLASYRHHKGVQCMLGAYVCIVHVHMSKCVCINVREIPKLQDEVNAPLTMITSCTRIYSENLILSYMYTTN